LDNAGTIAASADATEVGGFCDSGEMKPATDVVGVACEGELLEKTGAVLPPNNVATAEDGADCVTAVAGAPYTPADPNCCAAG